jgi:EamA domain-containing membrane protein RarD
MPIYDNVNLLDVAGPLEMFYWASQHGRANTVGLIQFWSPLMAML